MLEKNEEDEDIYEEEHSVEIFDEVFAPDDLLNYKGIHFRKNQNITQFTDNYGIIRDHYEVEESKKTGIPFFHEPFIAPATGA